MFEQLKKRAMKSVIARLAVSIVIIFVLLIIFGTSFIKYFKGPTDLYSLSMDELPGSYVEGDINALIDVFAEYYVKNDNGAENTTDNYYIVPIGEQEYFALKVNESDFDIATQIYDETYEYLTGTRDELTTTMHIKGTFSKMSDEVYDYYMDWFQESGYVDESSYDNIENIALPYVLEVDYVGGFNNWILYIAMAACVIILLYAIVIIIKGITGIYLLPVKKFIKNNENTISTERIEADYQNGVSVQSVKVGESFTFYFKGSKAHILKNTDILWAYLEQTTHRVNGIKTGVTKSLVICTREKKKHSILMKNASNVNSVLAVFSKNNPHIILGFSEELKKCYQKDFDSFINLCYRQEAEANEGFRDSSFDN
jgi:hypothetical protein